MAHFPSHWEIKVLLTAVFLFNLIFIWNYFWWPLYMSYLCWNASSSVRSWSLLFRFKPSWPGLISCIVPDWMPHTDIQGYTQWQYTLSHEEVKSSCCTDCWIPTHPPKSTYIHIWWQLCVHPAVLKNEWIIYAWVLYHDVCDDKFGTADHLMFSVWMCCWLQCVVLSSCCARRQT